MYILITIIHIFFKVTKNTNKNKNSYHALFLNCVTPNKYINKVVNVLFPDSRKQKKQKNIDLTFIRDLHLMTQADTIRISMHS